MTDFFENLRNNLHKELIDSLKEPDNWRTQKDKDTYLFTDPLQYLSKIDLSLEEMLVIFRDHFNRDLVDWKRIDNDSHFHHLFKFLPLNKSA